MIKKSLQHMYRAFYTSLSGLRAAWKSEFALRLEILFSLIAIPLAIFMARSSIEFILLFLSWSLILLMELVNSAIEAVVDRVGFGQHPLSKRAKDIGSACVFVAILQAVVVWSIVLYRFF